MINPNMQSEGRNGRGAQVNPSNHFEQHSYVRDFSEGIDEWEEAPIQTQFLDTKAKTLVNKVDSPDVGMYYSINPYQGCEHGCVYCYARNSHEFWGYNSGSDFESKILVKKNAPELLRRFLKNPKWEVKPLSLSGNTDCYQPAEKQFRITRRLLEICLEFRQPVSIITKNALVLRDLDILKELAHHNLTSVIVSVTSFEEKLRRVMEPRTVTGKKRLQVVEQLANAGIPSGVMLGPMIPGLNDHEMPQILEAAAKSGAVFAGYTFIRLNGTLGLIFHNWLQQYFPDRAAKVWSAIEQSHGGKVNDSRFGTRMRGEGPMAEAINKQFKLFTARFGLNKSELNLNTHLFRYPGQQMDLFGQLET